MADDQTAFLGAIHVFAEFQEEEQPGFGTWLPIAFCGSTTGAPTFSEDWLPFASRGAPTVAPTFSEDWLPFTSRGALATSYEGWMTASSGEPPRSGVGVPGPSVGSQSFLTSGSLFQGPMGANLSDYREDQSWKLEPIFTDDAFSGHDDGGTTVSANGNGGGAGSLGQNSSNFVGENLDLDELFS
jgi:hypothetical protein